MTCRYLLSLSALVCTFVLTGCGASSGEVKVTGSVMRGGKAQDGVRVSFSPSDGRKNASKGAVTDAQGKFEVLMQPGKYVVTLSKMVDKKGKVPGSSENPAEDYAQLEASGALRQVFPVEFTEVTGSPFTADIPSGGKALEPFVVSK